MGGLIRGWLYIGAGAVTLALLVWLVDHNARQRSTAPAEQAPPTSIETISEETSPPVMTPEQSAPTPAELEQPAPPLEDVEQTQFTSIPEAQFVTSDSPEPTAAEESAPVTSTPIQTAPAQTPSSSREVEISEPLPTTPHQDDVEEPVQLEPGDPPIEGVETVVVDEPAETPNASANVGDCSPLAGVAVQDLWANAQPDVQDGMVWTTQANTQVLAAFAGVVVKLSESPFTGTSLYLHDPESGRVLLYGRLAGYVDDLQVGQSLGCGEPLGQSSEMFYLGALKSEPGADWWRGGVVSPHTLFEAKPF